MLSRRKFIQQTAYSAAAMLSASAIPSFANVADDHLTILHTNDVHSRLEPFPMDGGKYQGLGGVAPRATIINQIRSEEENVLLLDAGDMFQGTSFFNVYKGEPEIKAMSKLGYDAATIGNHDFDAGLENLALQLNHATFPIVISNYDFTNTPMEGKTKPYDIIKRGKIKIGVVGIGIELKGLVPENLYGKTAYLDPIEKANETADILKNKHKCDFIICLSHLGYKYNNDKVSDEVMVQKTDNIDLIIGGHTHTFFEEPKAYKNLKNKDVIINQVGFAGINIGCLKYTFNSTKKNKLAKANTVVVMEKTSI